MRVVPVAAEFIRQERGAEVVEYAVIVALIVGATIVALVSLLAALISQNEKIIQILTAAD